MPRYVAFLRGVSPMNAKMPQLKAAFETVAFGNVRTVLASGNVVFDTRAASVEALQRKAEKAMEAELERGFLAIVRSVAALEAMLAADPFARLRLPAGAKRVVTFLRDDPPAVSLPSEVQGARILGVQGREVFTAYVPQAGNPVFMNLIEKTFGKEVTTRTWDTVRKCAVA
ncbi:MAG: DUF1697 domain-containing protein [Comamonadaceae bacterium]|nr:MAG: DUF1697 domain-containing protein [Comamonadaceae bacterium]